MPQDALLSEISDTSPQRFPRDTGGFLPVAVGFYLAFRIFIVLLSVRVLSLEPQTGTGINLSLGFLLFAIAVFCAGQRGTRFRELARRGAVRWALAFLAFSCCSLLWSSTASPAISVAYWCGMASDFAVVALLLRAQPVFTVAESLMGGYIWGACAGAVIAWMLPAQSDLRLGDEELLGPNSIGYVCALAIFFAQFLVRRRRGHWIVAAALLSVTVLRCLSKTTIAALLVSEGFLLVRDGSIRLRTKLLLAAIAVLVVGLFSALLTSYFDVYRGMGNQFQTLSGRLGIWAWFLAAAVQQPWLGHGFDSVWKVVPPFPPDQFEAPHAHNEMLQQFYAYGAVGVCLFVGLYLSLWNQVRRLGSGALKTFFLGLLIFVLVRGFADTERFDLSLPLWSVLLVSAIIERLRAGSEEQPISSAFTLPARVSAPAKAQPASTAEWIPSPDS